MTIAAQERRQRRWYSPLAIARSIWLRPRGYLSCLAGGGCLMLLPQELSASMRESLAWTAGGVVYLLSAFHTMRKCGADIIETRAARQDDSRALILIIILLAIASSFAGIAGLLGEVKQAGAQARLLYIGLAALTIVVSWTVCQVVFALHYAHEFYRPEDSRSDARGGLDFPGCPNPDYWDFIYFSTSIGATSQTSDVAIRSRAFRRLVTLHAVVSFVFNTMILALTVNLAASLAT